jgi:hypothetical protein
LFSAADLIDALQQRQRRRFPLHADRPFGSFPPTWRAWFLSIHERVGAVIGAPAADFIAVLAARPLRSPPRATPPLSRWQGFSRIWRQQWEPALREQRWLRRFAAAFSTALHVVFALLLLVLGLVPIGDAPPRPEAEGEALLVEYVGIGTPEDTGGAPAEGEVEAPAAAAAQASPAASADGRDAAAVAPQASAAPAANEQPPTPTEPSQAAAPQPLMVTETPAPDIDFTLPAPVPREAALPQLQPRVPEIAAQPGRIETFEPRTEVRAVEARVPQVRAPTVPTLRTEVVEVETQRTPATVVAREAPALPSRVPQLNVPELRTAPGEVALRPRPAPAAAGTGAAPAATPAQGPAPTPGPAPGTATTPGRSTAGATTPRPGGQPQASGSGRPAASAPAGVGPSPSPRPGGAPSRTRGDDWGASDRNVPGSGTAGRTPGLFNSDGSIRLPGDGGQVGGGLPPGTVIEDFEKIDRMGTWLKRPPLDYTPSRFDRFWIPHGNLLEEWVRRGIRNVAIPIPGTSKRIQCTISLLQAGGGCTISDPNLQDQEATARPPPDVPFKPELQEDTDSLARPPGSSPP